MSISLDVRSVMTGNVLSQLLVFISLPFLTLFYTPEDIGIGNVVLMSANIFAMILSLRMDIAIFINSDREDLVESRLKASILFTCILFSLVFISLPVIGLFINIQLAFFWALLSLLIAGYNISICQLNLEKRYREFSYVRVLNTFLGVSLKLILGYMSFGWLGFVVALVSSYLFVVLFMIVSEKSTIVIKSLRRKFYFRSFWQSNSEFIRFNLTTNVINSFGQFLPIMLFSMNYGLTFVGVYTFSVNMMRAPVNLIGESIRKVLLQYVGEKKATENLSQVMTIFNRSTLGLFIVSIVVYIIGGVVLQFGSTFFLDNDWIMVLPVYWLLTPWFVLLLMNIPSSCVLTVFERHRFLFKYEMIFMAARCVSIIVPSFFSHNIYSVLIIFVITNVIFNIIYILSAYRTLRGAYNYA